MTGTEFDGDNNVNDNDKNIRAEKLTEIFLVMSIGKKVEVSFRLFVIFERNKVLIFL